MQGGEDVALKQNCSHGGEEAMVELREVSEF